MLAKADVLGAGDPVEEVLVQNVDLSGQKIPSISTWNSIFDHVSFAGSKINKFQLRDVRLLTRL